MKEVRYLVHFDGKTMVFYIKACAELYAGIHNTNVVEVLIEV